MSSSRLLPVVTNKQGFILRLQTGEPFFHQPWCVSYFWKPVAVWQMKSLPGFLPLELKCKTRLNSHLLHFPKRPHWTCQPDCAKHLYPHKKSGKSLQCSPRLRKRTPSQLYVQLYPALKILLSGSSETRQKAGLAPENARWERKLVMRWKPQGTAFQEGKVPETTIRKTSLWESKSKSIPTKICLTLGITEHSVSCPEILKSMTNYQIQMGVTKHLTFSKTFEII